MSLINPLALWLLPLLAVPLLLTRRRKPPTRLMVSNRYLWEEAMSRDSQRLATRTVRRSWLVAMQIVAIAAIVLSLCQPVITWPSGRTTLVFDVSASMAARVGTTTRLDAAREEARRIIGTLSAASRVRLIAATESPRDLGEYATSDPRLLLALDALKTTAGRADLTSALVVARNAATNNIVMLSDSSPSGSDANPSGATPVRWLTVGRPTGNVAVAHVAAQPTGLGTSAGTIIAVVRNFSAEPRDAVVEIVVDGRLTRKVTTQLPASGAQTIDAALDNLGHTITVTVPEADALPLDNIRWALVPLANRIKVALIGPAGSFLERALRVNPAVMLERFDVGSTDVFSGARQAAFDVLVCDGCALAEVTPLPALIVAPPGQRPFQGSLTVVDRIHPVAASLDVEGEAATAPLPALPDARVIVRAGGAAAVTASNADNRRVVHVGFDVSRRDFALSPAFPVLVANAIEWLAAERAAPQAITAGEPLQFMLGDDNKANDVRILGPDGSAREFRRAGRRVIVADTEMAGLYRARINEQEQQIVVNPVVDGESDLRSSGDVAPNQAEAPDIELQGEPLALGGWLAFIALGCASVEWRLRTALPS